MAQSTKILQGPLSNHEPEDWFANALKLVKPVRPFLSLHGDVSSNMTVDYETWLRISYKYAEALHLRVTIRQDRNDSARYFFYLGGISLEEKLLPEYKARWLMIDLNESITRGVLPLVNDQFRHMFGIKDGDKTFFRLYHRPAM
jgi:hypothetical protein